jgi:hypothetical protein
MHSHTLREVLDLVEGAADVLEKGVAKVEPDSRSPMLRTIVCPHQQMQGSSDTLNTPMLSLRVCSTVA